MPFAESRTLSVTPWVRLCLDLTSRGLSGLLFYPGCLDRGLDALPFFGGRDHRFEPKRLEPELTAPTLGVVEMLVFLVLDLRVGLAQYGPNVAVQRLGAFPDQLPVGVVLGFREHHGLAGHQLCRGGVPRGERLLHSQNKSLPRVLDDITPWGSLSRIQSQRVTYACQYRDMVRRLIQIRLPLIAQLRIQDALKRGPVNEHTTPLMRERLKQEFLELRRYHSCTPLQTSGRIHTRGGSVSRSNCRCLVSAATNAATAPATSEFSNRIKPGSVSPDASAGGMPAFSSSTSAPSSKRMGLQCRY